MAEIWKCKSAGGRLSTFSMSGVGAKWPTENQKGYFSGSECQIDLKPGWKCKFFCCLEVYAKKIINMGLEGPWRAFIWLVCPKICLKGSISFISFGVPWRSRRAPDLHYSTRISKKLFQILKRAQIMFLSLSSFQYKSNHLMIFQ